jgi:hypothetical protein
MKAAICLPNKEENIDWGGSLSLSLSLSLSRMHTHTHTMYLVGFKVNLKVS